MPLVMIWHLAMSSAGPLVMSERVRAVLHASDSAYADYVDGTSVFFPMPQSAWKRLPPHLKRMMFDRPDWKRGSSLQIMSTL